MLRIVDEVGIVIAGKAGFVEKMWQCRNGRSGDSDFKRLPS